MQESQITAVTASELREAILCCFDAKRPVMIWGNPGIGKSQSVDQLAVDQSRVMLDWRLAQYDAVDLRGVPFTEKANGGPATTRWAVPANLPTGNEILFLDEINNAPQIVQAAGYQLVLDRRLGEYVLPDGVDIVAAGNLESDRAITNRMSTALASRFVHFELVVDNKAWMQWAMDADIATEILAYLSWRPENLHQFDPKSASKAQPDPRAWEYVNDIMNAAHNRGVSSAVEQALYTGKLGEAVGTEFFSFLAVMRDLRHWTEILSDPTHAKIYEEASTMYALCTLLAKNATEENFPSIIKYLDRVVEHPSCGPEYMMLTITSATRNTPELMQTRTYIEWASKHSDWLV